MDIKIQNGENLSLAIKKALINEGAKQESFSGSVWNKILDLVDQQNKENKANGEDVLYQGGSTRKPADWKRNYKVFANQILKFSENTWNRIRAAVGLGAKETPSTQKDAPSSVNQVQVDTNANSLVPKFEMPTNVIPNFGLETPNAAKDEERTPVAPENTNTEKATPEVADFTFTPAKRRTGTEPDSIPQAKPDTPASTTPVMPDAEPIPDIPQAEVKKEEPVRTLRTEQKVETKPDEQVKKTEQPAVQQKKEQKVKTKKRKASNPVTTTKRNSDNSTTITTTQINEEGATVKTIKTTRPDSSETEVVETTTSADGKTVTVVKAKGCFSNDKTWGVFSSTSPRSKITTTDNADGTKTISFEIEPKPGIGGAINVNEVMKGTYSVDKEGNVFAQLKDGGKVSISTNVVTNPYRHKTEIKLTDKDGKEVAIPLFIDTKANGKGKLSDFDDEQKLQTIIGGLTSALADLQPEVLSDLKAEVNTMMLSDNVIITNEYGNISQASGGYTRELIQVSVNNGLTSSVLSHEIGHAVDETPEMHINNNQAEGIYQTSENQAKFDKLIQLVKDKNVINYAYALTNNKEFFAEYYSAKNGGGLAETKELLAKLEETQDTELKAAYEEVKNICEAVISDTRSKKTKERMNMNVAKQREAQDKKESIASDVIKNNQAKLKEIFAQTCASDSDFVALYYDLRKTDKRTFNVNKQFLNKIFYQLPSDVVSSRRWNDFTKFNQEQV